MALLDDLGDSEDWKIPPAPVLPLDDRHPNDPHEETATRRLSRVAARQAAKALWARVQAEIQKR